MDDNIVNFSAAMAPINAIDPSIKTFDDLLAMPDAAKFNELVQKGNSLGDAFKLTRLESIANNRANEAVRTAMSRTYGKAHLSATTPQGGYRNTIPQDTLEMYRAINPNLSDDEYRKHYGKHNLK